MSFENMRERAEEVKNQIESEFCGAVWNHCGVGMGTDQVFIMPFTKEARDKLTVMFKDQDDVEVYQTYGYPKPLEA